MPGAVEADFQVVACRRTAHFLAEQALDLAAATVPPDEDGVRMLQAMKTGALIRFGCEAGAILGNADAPEVERMRSYGETIGLAFQLADDLIDATASAETAGKATAKDAGRGKATLVAVHGVDGALKLLDAAVEEALRILRPFGSRAEMLRAVARFVAAREA